MSKICLKFTKNISHVISFNFPDISQSHIRYYYSVKETKFGRWQMLKH